MNLLRAAVTVGGFTALSRIFGLIREILLSHILGASFTSDVFVIAFKFPNFFRRFFAEGAFNAAFVPQFAECVARSNEQKSKDLAQKVFSCMAWFLLVFVIIVEIATPLLMPVLAPGFSAIPERLDLAVKFTRITFPYIFFISLSALLGGVLNSLNHFAMAAAAPILLNLTMICGLLFYPVFKIDAGFTLCWSVFLAGIIQFSWLYWACKKLKFKLQLTLPRLDSDVVKIFKLMIPGAIGAGIMQINIIVDMMLASFLSVGSLSYLYYADRLSHLPLSIFGVAIGTALLPSLSQYWRQGNAHQAHRSQNIALDFALQLTIPSAIGLIVLSIPLIDLIFGHGSFQDKDVMATAPALAAFAFGLPAYVAGKVFTTTYFAHQDTKTPVKIGAVCIAVNLLLNLIFLPYFKHVGMALATSLAAWANTLILGIVLKRRELFQFPIALVYKSLKIVLISLIMGIFLNYIQTLSVFYPLTGEVNLIRLLILVAGGGILYLGLGYPVGIRPFRYIKLSN